MFACGLGDDRKIHPGAITNKNQDHLWPLFSPTFDGRQIDSEENIAIKF